MRNFKLRHSDHRLPYHYDAYGETAEAVIANFEHCFGCPFELVPTTPSSSGSVAR